MPFELTDDVQVDRDDDGRVMHLEHIQQPVVAIAPGREGFAEESMAADVPTVEASTPQALAEQYLRAVAPIYQLNEAMLPGSDADGDSGLTAPAESSQGQLELTEEKEVLGTTVVSYQQTYHGVPVWEGGVSVTMLPAPLRVTASQSSVHSGVDVVTDTLGDVPTPTPTKLRSALGLGRSGPSPRINGTPRRWIYAYDPDRRFDPEASADHPTDALQEAPPTLPLPPLPAELVPGQHYVVTEILFTLPLDDYGDLHWRAFLEETTGAVVYLRAFVASATGLVFRTDPLTAGGVGVAPTATAVALNPFRSNVQLEGLVASSPQELQGAVVEVVDLVPPVIPPPAAPNPPASFAFDAPAREFAAVNAYHHCDWLFRHMEAMGFNLATYFDGTTFPVPVDACAFGDQVNARAPGNTTGTGSGGFQFGLAGAPFPAVSIAADVRVVLHEFGHTLLWDSVHSPNFGFAHSAGDSLAAVLLDPESALRTDPVRRFETFPWILPNRNHGRDVAAGWGWGGTNDVGSYSSEQILSTTLFRFYRSIGGDSGQVATRRRAARETTYLIFRAIGSLATDPVTPTWQPTVFATALTNADIGTANFEGYRGGALHKVLRWAFERQGLYQPPGAPGPVTTPGAPPAVDVYVDDGRSGEYAHQPVHWECTEIWNRLDPNSGGGPGAHETPVVGQTNYAFVRVRNRGTQSAAGVVVRGYSADPSVGLSWPGDWLPMDDPQIAVPGNIQAGSSVVVGPFAWRPQVVGHECMFMEVSAPADRSNIDPATFFPCASGPTPEWRLVPFDNNLAQRNVCPVPGGGGIRGLLSGFVRRTFTIRNPLEVQARIKVTATIPKVLAQRGWRVRLSRRNDETAFGLAPGAERKVAISLRSGRAFTSSDVEQDSDPAIRVHVFADNTQMGGMTYQLDPSLKRAPAEQKGIRRVALDDADIEAAVGNVEGDTKETQDLSGTAAMGTEALVGTSSRDQQEGAVGDTGQLLSRVGLPDALGPRAHRVTVREVTVDIELD